MSKRATCFCHPHRLEVGWGVYRETVRQRDERPRANRRGGKLAPALRNSRSEIPGLR